MERNEFGHSFGTVEKAGCDHRLFAELPYCLGLGNLFLPFTIPGMDPDAVSPRYPDDRTFTDHHLTTLKTISKSSSGCPRWSPENRPYMVTSKPANEADPEQEQLYVNAVAVACRDDSANSEGWVSARAVAGRALQFRTSDSRLRMPLGQSALGGLSARRGPTRFPR